jgi:hypothetical protein
VFVVEGAVVRSFHTQMQALLIQNYQQQYKERSEEPHHELAIRKFTVLATANNTFIALGCGTDDDVTAGTGMEKADL